MFFACKRWDRHMVNTLWIRNHWHTKTDKRQGSYNTDYNPNAVYINVIKRYVLTMCNWINYKNFKNVWVESPYISLYLSGIIDKSFLLCSYPFGSYRHTMQVLMRAWRGQWCMGNLICTFLYQRKYCLLRVPYIKEKQRIIIRWHHRRAKKRSSLNINTNFTKISLSWKTQWRNYSL